MKVSLSVHRKDNGRKVPSPSRRYVMPARDRRRKKRPKGAIDWNLTNIGAAISMIGFLHFILIFFLYLMTGYIGWFLAIPGIILLAVGYALIVKDYFDQKKKGKGPLTRRRSHPEEE